MNSLKKIKLKKIQNSNNKRANQSSLINKISNNNIFKSTQETVSEKLKKNKNAILYSKLKLNSRNHLTQKILNHEKETKISREIQNYPNTLLSDRNREKDISNSNMINPLIQTNLTFNNKVNKHFDYQIIKSTMKSSLCGFNHRKAKSPYLRKFRVIFDFNSNNYRINDSYNTNTNSTIKGNLSNSKSNISLLVSEESDNITIRPANLAKRNSLTGDIPIANSTLSLTGTVTVSKPMIIPKENNIISNLRRMTKDLRKNSPNFNCSNDNFYTKLDEYKPLREIMRNNSKYFSVLLNDYYSPKGKKLDSTILPIRKNKNKNKNNRYDISENSSASNIIQLRDWIQKRRDISVNNYYSTLSPSIFKERMLQSQSFKKQIERKELSDEPFKCLSNHFIKKLLVTQKKKIY